MIQELKPIIGCGCRKKLNVGKLIGTEGKEFIVTDGTSIYKTNAQIIPSRLTTTVGSPARTKIQTLTFDDEDVIPKLGQIASMHSDAAIKQEKISSPK